MWSADDAGELFLLQAVALAADIGHVAVVEQPVQNRRGNHGVCQHFIPLSKGFVRGENDRAVSLETGRDQGKERRRCDSVILITFSRALKKPGKTRSSATPKLIRRAS